MSIYLGTIQFCQSEFTFEIEKIKKVNNSEVVIPKM